MLWLKIESLSDYWKNNKKMFVVKAIDIFPNDFSPMKYTTDPYCVWMEDGDFVRWPHPFPPTHYTILPEEVE